MHLLRARAHEMGKLHKEDDAATAGSGGPTSSRSVRRKRELGWKMIYIVTVIGFIGTMQLILVENGWRSYRYRPFPLVTVEFGRRTASFVRSASSSSQHDAAQLPSANPDNQQQHSVELQERRYGDIEAETIQNEKLLEFSPSDSFLPMKDVTQSGLSWTDTNWFMSGLRGHKSSSGETFDLPRDDPAGRLLCVRGTDQQDGTKNSYGLFRTLPADALLLTGTTFIADNYWDYGNPWHAMSALANFATWRLENKCAAPDRLLLYHMGELVDSMGGWITHLLHAVFMKPVPVETLTRSPAGSASVCMERAVVQRRGLGMVDEAHIHAVFELLQCSARRYCGVPRRRHFERAPEVLLYTRSGPRAFANESGVAAVVRSECAKAPGCNLRVVNAANLTFCEQVEVMSGTDVLISVHGAQLTNMMFMDPGSRVMELFPKGWLEFAGLGQEIYKWLADWTRVVHAGRWRDPDGPECPFPTSETLQCLFFFKDREVGLNATHLALWTRSVLAEYGKASELPPPLAHAGSSCACDETDPGSSSGASFATDSKFHTAT